MLTKRATGERFGSLVVVADGDSGSTNRHITAFGETRTLSQWSESTGIGVSTISYRIRRMRMTPEQAISTPIKKG